MQTRAKFHPLKYLSALAAAIPGKGSFVFENTKVEHFDEKPLAVRSGKHKIKCDYLVLATHTPLMGTTSLVPATLFQTKIYPYTSYAIGARLSKGLLPEASFWDTGDPYYYLRIDRRRGFDFAVFGGEDHKTGQKKGGDSPYVRLQHMLHKLIPSAEPTHQWSGQVIESSDGLPFIGETATVCRNRICRKWIHVWNFGRNDGSRRIPKQEKSMERTL